MLAILNSLSAGEIIAILVIALIVLGPEKLPDAIRKFGNIYGELRRMSHGFQSELKDAFDEPLRELRGTAQMMQDAVNEPVQAVKSQMTAPVVGGGKAAEAAKKTEGPVEETQAPVEETQAPVEETPGARRRDAGARRRRPKHRSRKPRPRSRKPRPRSKRTRASRCSPRPA